MRVLGVVPAAALLALGGMGAAGSPPVHAGVPGDMQGRLSRSATGDPVEGVVRARLPGGRLVESRTGADGLFRLSGLPVFGEVDLELSSGDLPPLRLPHVLVPGDGPLDLGNVEFGDPVAIEVLVLDPLGAPVPRQRVTVHRPEFMAGGHSDATYRIPAPVQTPAEVEATTADDGRAALPPMAPGPVVVQVQREGFARAVEPRLLLEGEAPDRVVVVLEPEAAVAGTLRDASGAPVPGARVSLGWREFPVNAPGFTSDAAITGTDGAFRISGLRPGHHVLAVRTGSGRVYTMRDVFAGRGGPLDLVVPGGAEEKVRVLADEDGTPLAGTPVEIEVHQESGPGWTSWFRAVTDSGGVASFHDLPPGKIYSLRPLVPGRTPEPELTSRSQRWELLAGVPRVDEVRVARGVALSGTVRDGTGAPLPGARLRLVVSKEGTKDARTFPPVRCDGEGRFRIEGVPPGDAAVLAEPPVVGDSRVDGDYWQFIAKERAPDILTIHVGKEPEQSVALTAMTGGVVRGTVKDPAGTPVPGMLVNVHPETRDAGGGMGRACVTGSDGSFTVRAVAAAPGTRVSAWSWGPGGRQGRSPAFPLDEKGSGSGAAVVIEEGAGLAGVAVDGDGKPVPGARLLLFSGKAPSKEEWRYFQMSSAPIAVPVGPEGLFRRGGLRRGWWTPMLTGPGLEATMGAPVELRPGTLLDTGSLAATPSTVLEGVVQRAPDEPIVGARVSIERIRDRGPEELPGEAPLQTDSHGRFRHVGGPPGHYVLTVVAFGFQRTTVPVQGGRPPVRIVMEPALSISGRVLDAETGEPVPGIEVECGDRFEVGRTLPAILTDAEGAFRAEGLPPGRRKIEVGHGSDGRADYAPVVLEGVEAGTENLVVRLRHGLTISGRVLDSSGNPIGGRIISVDLDRDWDKVPEGEPAFLMRSVTTGPDGSFVVKGLLAGQYRVTLEDYMRNDDTDPVIPVERLHVDAGTVGLMFVQLRGVRIRVRLMNPDGTPVDVDGSHLERERRYLVWTRRAKAPSPGDPDFREANSLESVKGQPREWWYEAALESSGTFIQGPCVSGVEHEVFALDAQGGRWGRTRAAAATEVEIPVVLRTGVDLKGVVVDQDGNPVPQGVPVWARARDDLIPTGIGARATTEEQGKFRFEGLADGTYELHAGGGGSEFLVSPGEEATLLGGGPARLVVMRGVEISGKVVDRSARLGRAVAVVVYLEGGRSEAPVAEDGSFLLRGLPPGDIEVQVWVSGEDDRGVSFTYTIDCLPATAPAKGLELDITDKRGD